jgi:hypothetical protein
MEDKDEESSLTLEPYFEANLNSIDVDNVMHLLCAATHGQDEDDHHGRLGECGIAVMALDWQQHKLETSCSNLLPVLLHL